MTIWYTVQIIRHCTTEDFSKKHERPTLTSASKNKKRALFSTWSLRSRDGISLCWDHRSALSPQPSVTVYKSQAFYFYTLVSFSHNSGTWVPSLQSFIYSLRLEGCAFNLTERCLALFLAYSLLHSSKARTFPAHSFPNIRYVQQ